jgi:hypothetical protein
MKNLRNATILRLAANAYELNMDVANGTALRDENGHWRIGTHDLDRWLATHEGEELVLIMGALTGQDTVETKTCRTCGRDYTDLECPTCRSNRLRLRGQG